MKINLLFEILKSAIERESDLELVFSESGMILKKECELDYGFFPLGSGILNENKSAINIAEIEENGIMVLGNDFGTLDYLQNKCPDNKEKITNSTIRNLIGNNSLKLNTTKTFFTNIYLGVREGKSNIGKKYMKKKYRSFCHNFLFEQLNFINPKTVICLGAEVGSALAIISDNFKTFNISNISELYIPESNAFVIYTNDEKWGNRKFLLVPHPSFAHINWAKKDIKYKIQEA